MSDRYIPHEIEAKWQTRWEETRLYLTRRHPGRDHVVAERVVARDNTVSFANQVWQLERCKLRATLAGCRVTIHEHLDQTISITFGPHLVGRYNAAAGPLEFKTKTVEMVGKSGQKSSLTLPLIPTVTTTC